MVTTRGGDRGESSLYSGERLRKDDFIFEVLGDIDELSSNLGIVRSLSQLPEILDIQKHLLAMGAQIATSRNSPNYPSVPKIDREDVNLLEERERTLLERTPISSSFISPGDSLISAHMDVARTLARRCERRMVTLIRDRLRSDLIESQRYLNRLSDYLFILARHWEQTEQ